MYYFLKKAIVGHGHAYLQPDGSWGDKNMARKFNTWEEASRYRQTKFHQDYSVMLTQEEL